MKKFTIALAAAIALAALPGADADALTSEFKDIPATSPYLAYISDLKALGVVEGVSEGLFGPEQTLTRAQFAKLVALAFQLKDNGGQAPFADVRDHWADAYACAPLFKLGSWKARPRRPSRPMRRSSARKRPPWCGAMPSRKGSLRAPR